MAKQGRFNHNHSLLKFSSKFSSKTALNQAVKFTFTPCSVKKVQWKIKDVDSIALNDLPGWI